MQEYFDKYNSFERIDTNPTIDKPLIVFLGLTIPELSIGTMLFVLLGLVGDAPILGLLLGLSTSMFLKHFRKSFPKGVIPQFLSSIGLPAKRGVPNFFRRTRFTRLEP